jgi:hypothetical protein
MLKNRGLGIHCLEFVRRFEVQKAVQPRLEREPGLPVGRLRMTRLILALSLLAAPAALAQKVTLEFDQAADFSKHKSFAIRNGQWNCRNPALNSELVKKQIETGIANDLSARGLTEVSDHPDLNVVYQFGSARRNEIETYPAGWRGWGNTRRAGALCRGNSGD